MIAMPETDGTTALQVAEAIRRTIEETEFEYQQNQPNGNLTISPIEEPRRRLRMHVHVEAASDGTLVEMLALVEHLDANLESGRLWARPMMDIPLEEKLHEAYLAEMLRRRG